MVRRPDVDLKPSSTAKRGKNIIRRRWMFAYLEAWQRARVRSQVNITPGRIRIRLRVNHT